MAEKFSEKKCVPCESGGQALTLERIYQFLEQISGWSLEEKDNPGAEKVPQITKEYKFENFREALAFVNKVAQIAEQEGHHPNILIHDYRKVKLTLYTHAINGLHENDFILAAKVDEIRME